MSLNINLSRKHSLAGLADGWDDCYLTVKGASTGEVKAWNKQGLDKLEGEEAFNQFFDVLKPRVLGGRVIDTKDDGTTVPVDFGPEQAEEVLNALPIATLRDVFETCVGLGSLNTKS